MAISVIDMLLLAMGGYAILMVYTLSRPRSATALYFFLILLISFVWDLSYYLELVLPTLELKVLAHMARFPFLPWITLLWLAMIRSLLGVGRWLPRWFWVGYAVFCAMSVLVAMASAWHTWFQYDFAIHPVGAYGILGYTKGLWYRMYEFFQNIMAWFGLFLMVSAWAGATCNMRRSLPFLIIGFALPLVMNTLQGMGLSPVSHINLAPFTTIISVTVFAWMVLGYRALDIIPVARGVLLDSLRELVFVVDQKGRLVDMNQAAQTTIGRTLDSCLGCRVSELPNPWGDFFRACEGGEGGSPSIIEGEWGGQRRWMEGSCLDIQEKPNQFLGKLYVFRDITAERTYRKQQLDYLRMLEERKHMRQQELLIRDLHDGIGGQIAGISMISALAVKEEDSGRRAAALRKIVELAAEGSVEVRSLMATLESREMLWPDLIVEMRRHGEMFQECHGIGFSLSVEGEGDAGGPGLFAGMSLFRIFKEALNNVVKHAGAGAVAVRLSLVEGRMRLIIKDEGRGGAQELKAGRGLRNMRQRIGELGGTMAVANEQGVHLTFEAPLPLKAPDQGSHIEQDATGRGESL